MAVVLTKDGLISGLPFGVTKLQLAPVTLVTNWTAATISFLATNLAFNRMTFSSIEANWNSFTIEPTDDRLVFHVKPVLDKLISFLDIVEIANFMMAKPACVIGGTATVDAPTFTKAATILYAVASVTRIVRLARVERVIDDDTFFAIRLVGVTFVATTRLHRLSVLHLQVTNAVTVAKVGVSADVRIHRLILGVHDEENVGREEDRQVQQDNGDVLQLLVTIADGDAFLIAASLVLFLLDVMKVLASQNC